MSEDEEKIQIHRGLKGVHFDRSRVCDIDGRAGSLWYRGYTIQDLAEHSTFEETCYLLLRGELPKREELERFTGELKAARSLPAPIPEIVGTRTAPHPRDELRTPVPPPPPVGPDGPD